jgi:DNA (cytosine-5)-methyltransferase 1
VRGQSVVSWPQPIDGPSPTVRDAIADLPILRNGAQENERSYRCVPKSTLARLLRGRNGRVANNLVTNNARLVRERYSHIRQGSNWRSIPGHLMHNYRDRERCHEGLYRRLEWDSPARVIGNFRKNMLIHPTQDRGLSVREAARLQSFPDTFTFHGSIGFQQQQVGDAVPPLLAASVLTALLTDGHQ